MVLVVPAVVLDAAPVGVDDDRGVGNTVGEGEEVDAGVAKVSGEDTCGGPCGTEAVVGATAGIQAANAPARATATTTDRVFFTFTRCVPFFPSGGSAFGARNAKF
ncbi:MAG: hypothetical protein HYX90_10250 [Chloroflexi bacterium]|nr:hypothetical protein [Chloroflexota bacterium]